MTYFDLHSDTLYEAYRQKLSPISAPSLAAPLAGADFENRRVLAVWSDHTLSDEEAYKQFFAITDHFEQAKKAEGLPKHCHPILAVEDARLLAGDLSRLSVLYECGVRILTLTWQGNSCIGGAWNTDEGLTPFGKKALEKALALGMIIDLSHASDKTFWESCDIAKSTQKALIASHSNSRALCPHARCLTDQMFEAICACGGLVGISFVPYHLTQDKTCTPEAVLAHIKHFLSLGGKEHLAIGSDFDGVDCLPSGIDGIASIKCFAKALADATDEATAKKILWQNAARVVEGLS